MPFILPTPIRTDRPRIRPSYLTIVLIVVCTVVQILSEVLPTMPMTLTIEGQTVTIEQSGIIMRYGLWGSDPKWWAFFTHQFVHGGWMHLIGNMLFLWIFGSLIEDALRPWGLAALYLGGGVMAALTHIGVSLAVGKDVDLPLVGASGAIAAIMGLFMLRFYKTRVQFFYWILAIRGTFWVQSFWALLFWLLLELIDGLRDAASPGGGGVAHWAHVGGFVAGAIAAPFLGSVSAAKAEYITDDPETNVEYVKRGEAIAIEERALKADPSNAYQMRRLARAYRHAGEYESATQTYQQCVYRFASRNMMEQAGEVFLELLEHNDRPGLPPDVLLKLAQHLEPTHLPTAMTVYQILLQESPTRPEGEYALLRTALIYQQSYGQPYDAARMLYDFLLRYPNSQWAGYARSTYEALCRELQG